MSRPDNDHDSLDLGGIHDGEKSLSTAALVQEVLKMAKNRDRAELMILELMREYSFSFPRLKELLKGKLNTLESFILTDCRCRK